MTNRNPPNSAFTLIELVLVMVVLTIALAITAPSLRGWSHGLQVRDAADQFVAVARRAHTLSVSEARVYRLNVDANAGSYNLTVQDGENFTSPATNWGRTFNVPQGVSMTFEKSSGTSATMSNNAGPSNGFSLSSGSNLSNGTSAAGTGNANGIDFSPTGASDPATLTFTSEGTTVTVQSTSPVEGFVVVHNAGGAS